ncbi:MAG: HAMP domain-containing protein, partial [Nitrospirota bacterium]
MKISTKLYLTVAALTLLMVVSGFVGFMSMSTIIKTADRISKIRDSMNFLQEVRVACQRVLMPAHDYLLHGRKEEVKNFDVLLGITNEKLDELSRQMRVRPYYIEHPEEMEDILDKIREDLLKIEGISRKILNIPNPMGSIEAALWIDEMDSYADKLTDNLNISVEWNQRRAKQIMAIAYKTQTTSTITFIITILVFVGSSAGGGILIVRSINRAISRLVEGTERIAQGDLSHRVAIGAKDEISHLASSFNKMTEDLQATTVSRQFHEGITDGISDELMVIDPQNSKIISANKAFLERYGPRDEVIGKTCYEVTHGSSEPCKPPEHICPTEEALRTGMHSIAEH